MALFRCILVSSLTWLPAVGWAQQLASKTPAGLVRPGPKASPMAGIVCSRDSVPGRQPAAYKAGNKQLIQDLQRGIRYPAAALRAQASGVVFVSFVVDADGSVGEAHIVKSPSPLLNDEVLRAVKSLSGFRPALEHGRPVRGSLTCPVTFRITANTTNRVPVPALVSPPRGPVQPVVAIAAGRQVVEKVVSYRDSMYWVDNDVYWKEKDRTRRISAYQHYFAYDPLGRPATHTLESWASGRLLYLQQWRYEYGKDGRLAAKVGKWAKTTFQYNEAGQLSRITSWALQSQQWVMIEETLLTEKARLKNGNRLVLLATNNKRIPAAAPGAPLENYCTMEYTVAPDNSIVASTMQRYSYKSYTDVPTPVRYTFTQDKQANPLRDLQLDGRYYQFEFERSSPHNLVLETQQGRLFKSASYRYNEVGNPVYGQLRNSALMPYRDYTFTYAKIVVPAPLRSLSAGPDSVGWMSLYPNPAIATTVIQAPGIGPGEATLRLFTASGQLQRQTSFTVGKSFRETISVAGLEKGVYVVQVSNGTTVVTGKLTVE